MSARSAGQRKSLECALSMMARFSVVYRPVATKGGGLGVRMGRSASGSPMIFRTMRNFSGRSVKTGRVLSATGLYLRFAAKIENRSWNVSVVSIGTKSEKGRVVVLKDEVRMESVGRVVSVEGKYIEYESSDVGNIKSEEEISKSLEGRSQAAR
jgi:hypothetical protein